MKKLLLGTTALIAAGLVSAPAFAQIEISLGGKIDAGIAATSYDGSGDDDSNGFAFGADTDLILRFTGSTDNGLTFGGEINLDPENDADVSDYSDLVDEVFVWGANEWGRIEFGQTNGAAVKLGVGVQNFFGHSVNRNEDNNLDPFDNYEVYTGLRWAPLRNRINTDLNASEDGTKFSYYTPDFSGLTLGASYTPNPCKNDTGYDLQCVDEDFARNMWEVAGRYDRMINNVAFALFGGYVQGEQGDSRDDPTQWSVGSSAGFGGFVFTGVYANHQVRYDYYGDDRYLDEKDQWTGSVEYTTGPWRLNFQAGQSESGQRTDDDYDWGDYSVNAKYVSYLGGVGYMVAPGFEVGGGFQRINFERDTQGDSVNNDFDMDGTSFFLGTRLSF